MTINLGEIRIVGIKGGSNYALIRPAEGWPLALVKEFNRVNSAISKN